VLTGLNPQVLNSINIALAAEIRDYERMELVGQLSVYGNLLCFSCGEGDDCVMSCVEMMFGPDVKTADIGFTKVEKREKVWAEAIRLGDMIGKCLK
jgi:hypothetical protein